MTPPRGFAAEDARVRRLDDDRPPRARADYVLYWAQAQRRPADNAALAFAVARADELGLPCVVYESIRPDYPQASDRLHAFVLEGARDMAEGLAARGIGYAFFLPKTREEARGVFAKVAARAALVVTDDHPAFVFPAQNAAAAARAGCPYFVVDDCAIAPMTLFRKEEHAARTLRPKMTKALETWLAPIEDPDPRVRARGVDWPFEPLDVRADVDALVAACAIDHDVPRVQGTRGGAREAEARLERFLRARLSSYAVDRNDPSRRATSELSPYLHYGMISARRVALAAREHGGEGAEAFLEQLAVRRGLAFNHARWNPDHARWGGIPAWARATLERHAHDPQKRLVDTDALERGDSGDALWDAAQRELRARGAIQPYARMLWGKLPIAWFRAPREAHAWLLAMNDKYALDGRDPNTTANVGWCFGLHDRPWPERPIFGTVRAMSSASARRKLDFEEYVSHEK